MYKKFLKRLIDGVLSGLMLLFLWPLFILIAVAIKLDSKGPVIFKQTRLGLDGKEFK
ncbi:MAG: sugar transferase, partial [Clostridia bacterium]|nr:sugar transferase [Clostridia bacterium]